MKRIYLLLLSIVASTGSFAQNNIGIGTATPHASAVLDITSTTRGLLIPRMTTAERTAISSPAKGLMVFDNTTNTYWFHNGTAWAEMNGGNGGGSSQWTTNGNDIYNNNSGNTGIGTSAPGFKLDVNGRMRLRHANNQTAGLWLDGPVNTSIGFVGTNNNTTIGLYGNGGAGWAFIMDITNGNTGIGTTAPTAKLDVNGTLRLRGNSPGMGASLISTDANGNTAWQRAYAFKTEGLIDLADQSIGSNATPKIFFNTSPVYNVGSLYNVNLSEFTVPVRGIYHFGVTLESYKPGSSDVGSLTVRLMRTRGGVNTIISQYRYSNYISDVEIFQPYITNVISGDFLLEPQDVIWIQAYSATQSHTVYGATNTASFSGRLVTQLY